MSPVVANRRSPSTATSRCVGRDLQLPAELLAQGLGGALSSLGVPEPVLCAALVPVVGSERAGHLAEPALQLGDRRAGRRLQGVAALDRRPELVLGLGEPRRGFAVLGLRRAHVLRRPAARILGALRAARSPATARRASLAGGRAPLRPPPAHHRLVAGRDRRRPPAVCAWLPARRRAPAAREHGRRRGAVRARRARPRQRPARCRRRGLPRPTAARPARVRALRGGG